MFKSIVVAVDGSDQANRAIKTGAELAGQLNAKLGIVSVVDSNHMEMPEDLRRMAEVEHITSSKPKSSSSASSMSADLFQSVREASELSQRTICELSEYIVKQAARDAKEAGAKNVETSVEVGNPADMIVAYANRQDADLIVIGRRGFGQIKSLLLGSTSHKVTLLAHCSCLTVN